MHRRRGVGVKAVKKKAQEKESYASKAAEMEATEAAHVGAFLATFRRSLEAFAAKHKRGIREDPVFRRQFTAMCYETGVDPLRSSKGNRQPIQGPPTSRCHRHWLMNGG